MEAGAEMGPPLNIDQDSDNYDMKDSEADCKETAGIGSESHGSPKIVKIRPRVTSLEINHSNKQATGSPKEKKVFYSVQQVVTQDKEKYCDLLERDHKKGTPAIQVAPPSRGGTPEIPQDHQSLDDAGPARSNSEILSHVSQDQPEVAKELEIDSPNPSCNNSPAQGNSFLSQHISKASRKSSKSLTPSSEDNDEEEDLAISQVMRDQMMYAETRRSQRPTMFDSNNQFKFALKFGQ